MEILKKFITPNVLDPGYTFSASGTYCIPPEVDNWKAADFGAFVEKWPLNEMPELFGKKLENHIFIFYIRANIRT